MPKINQIVSPSPANLNTLGVVQSNNDITYSSGNGTINDIAVSGKKVDFVVNTSKILPLNNDSFRTIIGKITKWLTDLKTLAFKDNIDYNSTDIINKPDLSKNILQNGNTFAAPVVIGSNNLQPVITNINGIEKWRVDSDGTPIAQNLKGVGNRMVLSDSTGKMYNLTPAVSGENVITQTSSGIQNSAVIISQIAPASTINALATTTWNNGVATVTGYQGQYGFDSQYRYDCIADSTWRRTCENETKVDMFMATIDDSAEDKTFFDLNTLYPNAFIGQWVTGVNNVYIKKTSTGWMKIKMTAA